MEVSPVPPGIPSANPVIADHSTEEVHLDGADLTSVQRTRPWDLASLATTHQPPPWQGETTAIRENFIRQILGLNPFKTSYFSLYRPLKDWQSRAILAAAILFSIAAGVPLPLIGVVFGEIINEFPPPEDQLNTRLIQLMGIAIVYFAVTWGWSLCWAVIGERVSRKTREDLLERALGLDMAYFDIAAPDMTSILTEKTQTIQLGTSEKVGLFIASISYFLAAFTVGFTLNARLTGVLFVTVIPTMFLAVVYNNRIVSRLQKQAASFTESAAAVAESAIRSVHVVQAFGVSEQLAQDHVNYLRSALRSGIRRSVMSALNLGCIWCIAYSANALAFWYGHRLRKEEGNIGGAGTIYAVVFLILDASFVVGQFGPFIQTFALAAAAGEKVLEIMDHPQPLIDVYSAEGKEVEASHFENNFELKNVTFVYPARPTVRVLDDISIQFPAGKVTGVVGPSGSGKSTVTALLLRLYDPSAGKVLFGGEDLRDLNVSSLRSHMALVTQHPVLFTGTILDNIKQGLPTWQPLTDEEVLARCQAAADEAHCDFIEHLPNGIHTVIGSGHHSQLSGGQKQRITLARALVGNPSLLLLDEFTSAMDATSEAIVLDNLKKGSAASKRTTIIIAHRLVTVKDADQILVLKDGAVVEQGQHEELVKAKGVYAELIRAQQFDKKRPSSGSSSIVSVDQVPRKELPARAESHASTSETTASSAAERKKLNTVQIIARCFRINQKESPAIGLGLFSSMVTGSIIIGEAIIFGNLVQLLNDRSGSEQLDSQVSSYSLKFFVLALIAFAAYTCSGSAFGVVSENLTLRIRDISLRTILKQDIAWFSKPGHSHHILMSRINMDSGHLSGLSGVIIGTVVSVTTSIVGGITLAHIMAWKIAIVLLGAVPIMVVAGFLRLRILSKSEERHQTAYNAAAALASEACASIQTVAALGRERDVLWMYKRAVQKPYEESLKFSIWGNSILAFSLSITYFVYALAYWWGSKQVRSGNYDQRAFFTVLPALLFSAQAAGQVFSVAPEITRAKTAAQSVFALHDEQPSIVTDDRPGTASTNKTVTSSSQVANRPLAEGERGQLEFRNVILRYDTRPDVAALDDVSFCIKPGEYVAFVGRSGAGKSSTMHLIERFYDPTSGKVLLDGRDIRTEVVQEHRAKLGLVEQEPDLFPGSVGFNIGLGAKPGVEVTQQDIETVAKKCGMHDFIMGLPEGYNTDVGSRGNKLSGGQKQRIAITRALIRDPEVLLLDEATSQLDANTEREIRAAIDAAASGRTTVMIAHRLASVQHADRIFVFEAGKIVEQGTHNELVAAGGIYSSMVSAQELE